MDVSSSEKMFREVSWDEDSEVLLILLMHKVHIDDLNMLEFNFRGVGMNFDRKTFCGDYEPYVLQLSCRALLRLTKEKSQLWAKFLGNHDMNTLSNLKQLFADYMFKDTNNTVDNAKFTMFYIMETVLVGGHLRWLVRLDCCQLIEHDDISSVYSWGTLSYKTTIVLLCNVVHHHN